MLLPYNESFPAKVSQKVLHEWHNRESFQQDVATTKVFHREWFALYGI